MRLVNSSGIARMMTVDNIQPSGSLSQRGNSEWFLALRERERERERDTEVIVPVRCPVAVTIIQIKLTRAAHHEARLPPCCCLPGSRVHRSELQAPLLLTCHWSGRREGKSAVS